MSRKYRIDAKNRIKRRQAKQQSEAQALQALIQPSPSSRNLKTANLKAILTTIFGAIDSFIKNLQTQETLDFSEINLFMETKAAELKSVREQLPSTSKKLISEIAQYEKMALAFVVGLKNQMAENRVEQASHTATDTETLTQRLGLSS